jgi:hypothetical protein
VQRPDLSLAFLTFGNYSNTGNLVAMSRIPYLPSLQKSPTPTTSKAICAARIHDDFVLDRIERALKAETDATLSAPCCRAWSAPRACSTRRSSTRRLSAASRRTSLKDVPKERLAQQAEIALASFKAGVCVSAKSLYRPVRQPREQRRRPDETHSRILAGIAYLLRRAEELNIREKLVVVIQSEMGRTPNYNNGKGKDHWSIGSIMFMGQGIRGNASSARRTRSNSPCRSIPTRSRSTRKRASACGPSISISRCANSPASPITQ